MRGIACDCTVTLIVHGPVGVAARRQVALPGVQILAGTRDFLFLKTSRPAVGPTKPPLEWVPVLFLGGKVAGV